VTQAQHATAWMRVRQGDWSGSRRDDRGAILQHYLPFVEMLVDSVLRRFDRHAARRVDRDEMINDGILGLAEALERYRPGEGCSFRTYAGKRILGAIRDGLRARDRTPRMQRIRWRDGASAVPPNVTFTDYAQRALAEGRPDLVASLEASDADPMARLEQATRWEVLTRGLRRDERLTLSLRYRADMPLAAIAAVLGVSQSRASQIHQAALRRLRTRLGR